MRRLGQGGVLVGVDCTEGLLNQARLFSPIWGLPDFSRCLPILRASARGWMGPTSSSAAPCFIMCRGGVFARPAAYRPAAGNALGFIEPDFRSLLGRLAFLESSGRPELAALRLWSAPYHLYRANRLSPAVGATLRAPWKSPAIAMSTRNGKNAVRTT